MRREDFCDRAKAIITVDRQNQYGEDDEEWKVTEGFDPLYEVSNKGRVRTVPHTIMRSNGRPQTIRGRILKQTPDDCGYPMVALRGHTVKVHRLVALAFLGERKEGDVIRHMDGNPTNNNVNNLKYGTATDNVYDAYDYRGYLHEGQKLSPEDAAIIRQRLDSGERGKDIASEFNVSPQTICDIRHGRIYKKEMM